MINGLLFVNGIIGVIEYFHEPDGLELFCVKFHVGHWDSDLAYWTHQDSNLAHQAHRDSDLAHRGSSGLRFGYGFWGSLGAIRAYRDPD